MNTINTKTHSSKDIAEFSSENSHVKSICHCKQNMKSKLPLSLECVETKLCKLCTPFTSHLHSLCGMVWYRTFRVNFLVLTEIPVGCSCQSSTHPNIPTQMTQHMANIRQAACLCLGKLGKYKGLRSTASNDRPVLGDC